jgi:RHS repeat-associated protein
MNGGNNPVAGSRAWYLPFGGYRPGSTPTQTITDRDFTGQRENMELGLLYYNARFYAPYINRFISADTIVPDAVRPQSFNRYSYSYNNPISSIDPSGHHPCDLEAPASCDPLHNFRNPGDHDDGELWELVQKGMCISQGPLCDADTKFRLFGIPTTGEHWDQLTAEKASDLCWGGGGACTMKQVGIVFSGFMLPFVGIAAAESTGLAMFLGSLPTAFEALDALIRNDPGSMAQEVGFDVGGEVTDLAMEAAGLPGVGGYGLGVIDIALGTRELSNMEKRYLGEAAALVVEEVKVAEEMFMSAHTMNTYSSMSVAPGCLCSSMPFQGPYSSTYQPGASPLAPWQFPGH